MPCREISGYAKHSFLWDRWKKKHHTNVEIESMSAAGHLSASRAEPSGFYLIFNTNWRGKQGYVLAPTLLSILVAAMLMDAFRDFDREYVSSFAQAGTFSTFVDSKPRRNYAKPFCKNCSLQTIVH